MGTDGTDGIGMAGDTHLYPGEALNTQGYAQDCVCGTHVLGVVHGVSLSTRF